MTKNPQVNRQAEVSVRKITQKLLTALQQASYLHLKIEERSKYWDRVLPAIIYGMNTTYQERLGCSLYELMFGRLPPLHHTLRIEESNLLNGTHQSFHTTLLTSLEILHQTALGKQSLFRFYSQKQYDKFRPPLKIDKKDFVYVSPEHSIIAPKLSPPLEGPYRVVEVYRQQGTSEPTAIKVEIGISGKKEFRTYPRYRVQVIKESPPLTHWTAFEKEAEEEMIRMNDWEFVSPKSIDDSNVICQVTSCIDKSFI